MSGQRKLLKELFGVLGEGWVAQYMEGVEGSVRNDTLDSPEDGGTPWDRFVRGVRVGMVRNQREYRAKWGGSNKAASSQLSEAQSGGARVGGVAAITQPGFYRGVVFALHKGECCFKTPGSNPKWVPL